jgi:ADP-L-glycero-D-manno-heptose 6-epimerase
MKRAIVTGGTGYTGSVLAKKLLEMGWEVLITGKSREQPSDCKILGYDFHNLDWKSIGPIDVLFHQAAISDTTISDYKIYIKVNFDYPQLLFKQAINNGVKHIVYASSCAVYGDVPIPFREDGPTNPLNWYGKSKLMFDEWVKNLNANGTSIVGLRYSNIYGFGPKHINFENHKGKSASQVYQIGKQMKEGKRPKLFKWGDQSRDFVHISDVVEANILASNYKLQDVFNVGCETCTFNHIVEVANEILGTKFTPEYIDNPWSNVYQNFTSCDLSKSTNFLGYSPKIKLKEGMTNYLT